MAEFVDVVKQKARMCRVINNCAVCNLSYHNNSKGLNCTVFMMEHPEEAEKIIMEWAAAHPEPKYPSWRDAWKQLFPQACYGMDVNFDCPCPKYFLPCGMVNCNVVFEPDRCYTCKNNPIPADIAEKLGIKPSEVDT